MYFFKVNTTQEYHLLPSNQSQWYFDIILHIRVFCDAGGSKEEMGENEVFEVTSYSDLNNKH